MRNNKLSYKHKVFYQQLKKSLQNDSSWVFGSKNRTTDFVVLNIKKDVELYKIVSPQDLHNVDIWIKNLKKIYTLSWYQANYILVYVNSDYEEIKRDIFLL